MMSYLLSSARLKESFENCGNRIYTCSVTNLSRNVFVISWVKKACGKEVRGILNGLVLPHCMVFLIPKICGNIYQFDGQSPSLCVLNFSILPFEILNKDLLSRNALRWANVKHDRH